MLIYPVTNAERQQGFKDLSLARRDGGAETPVRVWRMSTERLAEFDAIKLQTERVRTICQRAASLNDDEFFGLDSSTWPRIYFAAFGLISAAAEHREIMRAREITRRRFWERF